MRPDDKVRLQHILDEANEACKYASDISYDEFLKDGKTARAIIRAVEVIGEAASKISDELRNEHPVNVSGRFSISNLFIVVTA